MKNYIKIVVSVVILMMLISCSSSYEAKGNKAFRKAQNLQGDAQRKCRKEAYIYYKKALETNPNKVGIRLRNRFIEMTLVRAEMVLTEGSAAMDALPLYMTDIDSTLTPDVDQSLRERYASFLVMLADSSFGKRKLYRGLKILNKAIGIAINKAPYEKKKQNIIDNFAKENFEAAEIEMVNGKTNEDAEALVRAEFLVQVALVYDKDYPGAEEMLSELRKANRVSYSAYEAVVIDKPDTNIYDQVNKYDILLAIPVVSEKGNSALLKVEMYNYSCNPQRLLPKHFYIVDENGKKFTSLSSSKFDREIVDQEHEVKMTLRFRKSRAKIKKLCFQTENGEHFTEKYFF